MKEATRSFMLDYPERVYTAQDIARMDSIVEAVEVWFELLRYIGKNDDLTAIYDPFVEAMKNRVVVGYLIEEVKELIDCA